MDTQKAFRTFKDLTFETRDWDCAKIARLDLGNDIQISVVGGSNGVYGYGVDTWEIAFFQNDEFLPVGKFDDVLGWQTKLDVSRHMIDAQKNGNSWVDCLRAIRSEFRKEMNLD